MKDLQEQKEANKNLEMAQSKMMFQFLKQKHERFEFADISQKLACDKKGEDLLFLGHALTKWHNKSTKDEQKKELLGLVQCLWRVDIYCQNIETVVQQAVSEHVTTERRNIELVREKRKLEIEIIQLNSKYGKEISELKKTIEFHEQTSKP